jgi:hypothetical protein
VSALCPLHRPDSCSLSCFASPPLLSFLLLLDRARDGRIHTGTATASQESNHGSLSTTNIQSALHIQRRLVAQDRHVGLFNLGHGRRLPLLGQRVGDLDIRKWIADGTVFWEFRQGAEPGLLEGDFGCEGGKHVCEVLLAGVFVI